MPNNVTQIINPRLIAQYQANGLTSISDNNDVMPRDKAGNIIISADTSSVAYLVIDPVTNLYTMKSALDVFDTQFRYFSFPVSDTTVDVTTADIDTTDFESNLLKSLIKRRYTIPYGEYPAGITISEFRVPAENNPTWFNNVLPGTDQNVNSWAKINFPAEAELTPGVFTITQDMIDAIKSTNQVIQFTVQLAFQSYADYNGLMRTNEIYIRLLLGNGSPYKSVIWPNSDGYVLTAGKRNQDAKDGSFPSISFKFNIDPSTMNEFDTYYIDVYSQYETKLSGFTNTFWDIDVVNDTNIYGITDLNINDD